MSLPLSPSAEAIEEIERLRRELEEAEERVRSLEALREDLVGLLAHDLRSPFAVIRGLAEILRDDLHSDPAEAADFLDRILSNADLGIRMAANAVEAVRAEGRRIQPCREPVDVAKLVDGVLDRFDALARVRHVTVGRRADPALAPTRLDPDMVDRALSNLLANTLQASPRGSRVTISIDRSGGGLTLILRGDGAEASETDRSRFVGNGAAPPVRDGNGLALYLAKRLVEAHGGEIRLDRPPGGGSAFTIHLPGTLRPYCPCCGLPPKGQQGRNVPGRACVRTTGRV